MENFELPRIVTIDGEPGAGKTTVCQLVADRLGYQMLTTGMFYCATADAISRGLISADELSSKVFSQLFKVDLSTPNRPEISAHGIDITETIFSRNNKQNSSKISSNPIVASSASDLARDLTQNGRWVIDRGSEVFPNAEIKVWLSASPQIRAARRCGQLALQGQHQPYLEILGEMIEREQRDRLNPYVNNHRSDFFGIDNTFLDIEDSYRQISALIDPHHT